MCKLYCILSINEAVKHYEIAASKGHRDAIRALGIWHVSGPRGLVMRLATGLDTLRDLADMELETSSQKLAFEFLERAARLGCMESMVRPSPSVCVSVSVSVSVSASVSMRVVVMLILRLEARESPHPFTYSSLISPAPRLRVRATSSSTT